MRNAQINYINYFLNRIIWIHRKMTHNFVEKNTILIEQEITKSYGPGTGWHIGSITWSQLDKCGTPNASIFWKAYNFSKSTANSRNVLGTGRTRDRARTPIQPRTNLAVTRVKASFRISWLRRTFNNRTL